MKQLAGRDVLLYLLAFFGIIIAVNVYFAFVAVETFRGEDNLKPYQEGIDYNQTLERRAAQEKLGWTAVFDVSRVNSDKVRVDVVLKGARGAPETKVPLIGELHHPSDENKDKAVKLVEVRAGEYAGNATGIRPGAWDLIVKTPEKDVPFEASRRMWVP